MKKKIGISLIFVFLTLMILGISTVYADVVFIDPNYVEYELDEIISMFLEDVGSPIKEIIVILIVLLLVLGLVLLTLNIMKNDEDKDEVKVQNKNEKKEQNQNKLQAGLQKVFLGISIILELISIYIFKVTLLFAYELGELNTNLLKTENAINIFISILYIINAIFLIIASIMSIKKKNTKILTIITLSVSIVLFLFCFVTIINMDAGYFKNQI